MYSVKVFSVHAQYVTCFVSITDCLFIIIPCPSYQDLVWFRPPPWTHSTRSDPRGFGHRQGPLSASDVVWVVNTRSGGREWRSKRDETCKTYIVITWSTHTHTHTHTHLYLVTVPLDVACTATIRGHSRREFAHYSCTCTEWRLGYCVVPGTPPITSQVVAPLKTRTDPGAGMTNRFPC